MVPPSLGVGRYLLLPLLSVYPIATALGTTAVPLAVFDSMRSACPASCDETGPDTTNWTAYHDVNRLSWCNQTMLLDFTLYNPLDDPQSHATIRCCAAGPEIPASSGANASAEATASRIAKRDNTTSDTACVPNVHQSQVQAPLQIAINGSDASASVSDFMKASQQMASHLAQQKSGCQQTVSFAYSGSAVVGLFAGSAIHSQGIARSVLQQFIASIESSGYSESFLVQLCSGNLSSRYPLASLRTPMPT